MTTTSNLAPLSLSPNGRYFVDKGGRPFFWLGDTLWLLYRAFRPEEVRAILQRRKEQGFSVVLVMLIGYERDPAPNLNGDLPWRDGDPSQPNESYFAHVDEVMRVACELDFVQVLGVYHKTQDGWYGRGKGIGNGESGIGPEGEERPGAGSGPPEHIGDRHRTRQTAGGQAARSQSPVAYEAARWIAERYREVPQIIWTMYPEARRQYLPIVRAMAEGLAEGDGGAHMITVHPDPSPQSSSFLHQEPWLAFNMLQTCVDMEQIYAMTAADYALTPVKPAVMAEGGYEGVEFGRVIAPLDIRRQAYWTYLAGGHHVYGHNDNWQAPEKWREWIGAPGAAHLGVYRRIITGLKEWWSIIPNQSIIAQGVGTGMELNAAGVSAAADWALVYLSGRHTVSVRMDRIKNSETVAATWIDPRSGDRERIGTFGYAEVTEFSTPEGWEDALLIVESGE